VLLHNYYCRFAPEPTSTIIIFLINLRLLTSSCLCVQDAEPATSVILALCQSTLLDIALVQPSHPTRLPLAHYHPAVLTDSILYPWPLPPLQQARHFNVPEINTALPIINTLYAMPSISQLSSTATNITQSNIRNADSDADDFSQCNDTSDCSPVVVVGNILIKKCSFLRNSFCLPPDVAFRVHCLSVISQHRGKDLNMFNQVMQCVSGHAFH
jgi:hypothetical protein